MAPSNALSVFNLLPLKAEASNAIGLDHGFKAALAAYIVAWATEDWRRPGRFVKQAVLKDVTDGTGNLTIVEKESVTFRREVPSEDVMVEEEAVIEST